MGWLLFHLTMALATAVAAAVKDRNPVGWFFYGLAAWPVALVHVLVAPAPAARRAERLVQRGEAAKCPHCAELIKPEAKVCRYCGRDVPPPAPSLAWAMRPCPYCAASIRLAADRCPQCHRGLDANPEWRAHRAGGQQDPAGAAAAQAGHAAAKHPCPACGHGVSLAADACPNCNSGLAHTAEWRRLRGAA